MKGVEDIAIQNSERRGEVQLWGDSGGGGGGGKVCVTIIHLIGRHLRAGRARWGCVDSFVFNSRAHEWGTN